MGRDKDASGEGRWRKTITTAHKQIHAQPVPKEPSQKTTLSCPLLSSCTPSLYCWQWHYPLWNSPLAAFGQLSLLCLVGRKYTIILPEWKQLPHTYVMFIWVVSLLIRKHRHLFDSAILFERIGFSRKWQDGLIIRRQTWETQLSQVVNEEIEFCGNTSQTGFDQSRNENVKTNKSGSVNASDQSLRKINPIFYWQRKGF